MFLVAVPNESTTSCAEIVKILYAVNGYLSGGDARTAPDSRACFLSWNAPMDRYMELCKPFIALGLRRERSGSGSAPGFLD